MQTRSTFLSPGTYNVLHMSLTKVLNTDDAINQPPYLRECLMPEENKLKYFKSYTQTNCYMDEIIHAFEKQCGCVGRYRGMISTDCTSTMYDLLNFNSRRYEHNINS